MAIPLRSEASDLRFERDGAELIQGRLAPLQASFRTGVLCIILRPLRLNGALPARRVWRVVSNLLTA